MRSIASSSLSLPLSFGGAVVGRLLNFAVPDEDLGSGGELFFCGRSSEKGLRGTFSDFEGAALRRNAG